MGASETGLRGANQTGQSSQPYVTVLDADSDTLSTTSKTTIPMDNPKETSVLTLGDRKSRLPSATTIDGATVASLIAQTFVYLNVISKYSYWCVDSLSFEFIPRYSPLAVGRSIVSYLPFEGIGLVSRVTPFIIREIGMAYAGTWGNIDIAKGAGCTIECNNVTNKQWFSSRNKGVRSNFPGIMMFKDIFKQDPVGGEVDVYVSFNGLKVYLPEPKATVAENVVYREQQGLDLLYDRIDAMNPASRNPPTTTTYHSPSNPIDRAIPATGGVNFPLPHKTSDDMDFDNIMKSWPLYFPFGEFSTARRERNNLQTMMQRRVTQAGRGGGNVNGLHPIMLILQAFRYVRYSVTIDFHVVRNNFQTGLFKVKYSDSDFTGNPAEGTVSSTYWNITSSDSISITIPYVDVKKYMRTSRTQVVFDFRQVEVELIGNIIPTAAGTQDSVFVYGLLTFHDVEGFYPMPTFLDVAPAPVPFDEEESVVRREQQALDDKPQTTSTMAATGRPSRGFTSFRQLLHFFSPTEICDPIDGLRTGSCTILDVLPMLYMNMSGSIQEGDNLGSSTVGSVFAPDSIVGDGKDGLGLVFGPTMTVVPKPLEINSFYCKEESLGDSFTNRSNSYNFARMDFSYPVCPLYLLLPLS